MVQDRKAVQAGTSHFLGQNFAKAGGIQFTGRDNELQYAWTTSWGVSTRMIGMMIMAHADDDGMVMPPRIAPAQVAILPVTPKPESAEAVQQACRELTAELRAMDYHGERLKVELDDRDMPGGTKNWDWIKKGVPLRVEIGPRDLEKGNVAVARRDKGPKEKAFLSVQDFKNTVVETLDEIQVALFQRASRFLKENTRKIDDKEEFIAFFTPEDQEKPEIHGGFALSHWCGDSAVEAEIQEQLKVTIRCIPFEEPEEEGKCVWTGQPSKQRVVFGKGY
jgi:prolyl-tRNA synthetase